MRPTRIESIVADRVGAERAVVRAICDDTVVASSVDTICLAGTVYFPPADIDRRRLVESDRTRTCLFYGEAHYLDLCVDGTVHPDAAWHWPTPSPLARHLPGWIGFGPAVTLIREPAGP
jgi:uncharacterized protein (DUF427 family)